MIEGREFREVARILVEIKSEASQRTQIGRSYYAAFLEARHYCEHHLNFVRTQSPREHSEVANALGRVEPQLKVDLAFLRSIRNGADYDVDLSAATIQLQADPSQRLARSIIARFDELTTRSTNEPDNQ